METRDFLRMPLGEFKAHDGIYNYTIKKSLSNDNKPIYTIRDTLSEESVSLFEETEPYFEGIPSITCVRLKGVASAGGVFIHGYIGFGSFDKFELLPRGSYKNINWIK